MLLLNLPQMDVKSERCEEYFVLLTNLIKINASCFSFNFDELSNQEFGVDLD